MKITTLEKYIKYTNEPYTKLLDRACKSGLIRYDYKDSIVIEGLNNQRIQLYPHNMKNIDEGMAFIIYNYPKN